MISVKPKSKHKNTFSKKHYLFTNHTLVLQVQCVDLKVQQHNPFYKIYKCCNKCSNKYMPGNTLNIISAFPFIWLTLNLFSVIESSRVVNLLAMYHSSGSNLDYIKILFLFTSKQVVGIVRYGKNSKSWLKNCIKKGWLIIEYLSNAMKECFQRINGVKWAWKREICFLYIFIDFTQFHFKLITFYTLYTINEM